MGFALSSTPYTRLALTLPKPWETDNTAPPVMTILVGIQVEQEDGTIQILELEEQVMEATIEDMITVVVAPVQVLDTGVPAVEVDFGLVWLPEVFWVTCSGEALEEDEQKRTKQTILSLYICDVFVRNYSTLV